MEPLKHADALADLINEEFGDDEDNHIEGLDILDFLGLLGLQLIPYENASATYQDAVG